MAPTDLSALSNTDAALDAAKEHAAAAIDKLNAADGDKLVAGVDYGRALNEGREVFTSDEEFGWWIETSDLDAGLNHHERIACMWAAKSAKVFESTKRNHPKVGTLRGLHAKFKRQIETAVVGTLLDEARDDITKPAQVVEDFGMTIPGITVEDVEAAVGRVETKAVNKKDREAKRAAKAKEEQAQVREDVLKAKGLKQADIVAFANALSARQRKSLIGVLQDIESVEAAPKPKAPAKKAPVKKAAPKPKAPVKKAAPKPKPETAPETTPPADDAGASVLD